MIPRLLYHQIQPLALKIAGPSQRRRIQQEESVKNPRSLKYLKLLFPLKSLASEFFLVANLWLWGAIEEQTTR